MLLHQVNISMGAKAIGHRHGPACASKSAFSAIDWHALGRWCSIDPFGELALFSH